MVDGVRDGGRRGNSLFSLGVSHAERGW